MLTVFFHSPSTINNSLVTKPFQFEQDTFDYKLDLGYSTVDLV